MVISPKKMFGDCEYLLFSIPEDGLKTPSWWRYERPMFEAMFEGIIILPSGYD